MDYRKIGQVLDRKGEAAGPARRPMASDLGTTPLGELGLLGLVERLALAIRSGNAPPPG